MIKKLKPEDFYEENGNIVFTAAYLTKRGTCCGCGCRHCPFPLEESVSDQPTPSINLKSETATPKPNKIINY